VTDGTSGPDEADFADFYRQHFPKIAAFTMRLGANLDEAADIAQQVFANSYSRWPTIRNHGAYLRTAATHEFTRRSSRNIHETLVADLPDPADARSPSVDKVDLDDQAARVVHMINTLPARQREVMAWTVDGFTPAEIASNLGISSGAVRGTLLKARRELKVRLNITQGGGDNA
jgi:RNA polymerase sigma-70 factor (ECF subfamily)